MKNDITKTAVFLCLLLSLDCARSNVRVGIDSMYLDAGGMSEGVENSIDAHVENAGSSAFRFDHIEALFYAGDRRLCALTWSRDKDGVINTLYAQNPADGAPDPKGPTEQKLEPRQGLRFTLRTQHSDFGGEKDRRVEVRIFLGASMVSRGFSISIPDPGKDGAF